MAKRVVGYVRDNPGGIALSGKTITLKDANTDLAVSTGGEINLATNPVTSDANGKFTFTMDLNPGPIYVHADLGASNKRVRYGAEVMQADSLFLGELAQHFKMFADGVIKGILAEFLTTASGVDRTITIQPGYANIQGNLFGWDSGNKTETGSSYGGAGTRYDFLVLRQYIAGTNKGKQQVLIIEGTDVTDPPVTSSEADLTKFIRGTNIWDLPIKRVKTASGASVVTLDDLVNSATYPYASPAWINPALIGGGAVSATEFGYLDGVTSAIQTQIDAKQPLAANLTTLAANITAAGHALVDDANASAQRTTLGLAIGSDVQAYSALLAAIVSAGEDYVLDRVVMIVGHDNTDYTNTSTSTDTDAARVDITLPAGTWTIYAIGWLAGYHSAANAGWTAVCQIDGTDSSAWTWPTSHLAADQPLTLIGSGSKTGVSGDGTKVCKVRYHSFTAGTATVTTSGMALVAFRTA